jgi:hypothetical protein
MLWLGVESGRCTTASGMSLRGEYNRGLTGVDILTGLRSIDDRKLVRAHKIYSGSDRVFILRGLRGGMFVVMGCVHKAVSISASELKVTIKSYT